MKFSFGRILVILAGFILIAAHNESALADLEVIESDSDKYVVGTKISDADELNISEGQKIKLLQSPSNKVYTLKGPYRGQLKDYKEKQLSFWEKWFGWKKEPDLPVGGTREFKSE